MLIAAAQLQHRVAVLIRSGAKRKHRSIGAYAEAIGQTPKRPAKVFRGEDVMRLEDIAAARLHLDLNIEVTA